MEISPMLLSEVDDKTVLDRQWIFQEKYNGVRAIIHIKGGKIVGIRGRSNNPLLYCFPELKDATFDFDTAVLDAECCVLRDGKSVFYKGIDQRRSSPDSRKLRECPVTAIVFDIISFEGEVLVNKPYQYRINLLEDLQPKIHGNVKVIESTNDGRQLWKWIVENDREGLVVRDPKGLYEIGVRSKYATLKLKNYKYVDVVVEKVEPNPKGTKIYSQVVIGGKNILVEAQQAGAFTINVGDTIRVKYLDIVGERLIQPTRA